MTGINLSSEDGERLKESVENLSDRYRHQRVCKYCADAVVFKQDDKKRFVPHDLDGTPHWRTCPYESLTQKRASFGILKKAAVYLSLNHPKVDLEADLGLSEKEGKVLHAILEKVLKQNRSIEKVDSAGAKGKVDEDFTFNPVPTDPIGDPDEEIAPSEDLVKSTSPDDLAKK